jgi:hypothetical protein
MNKKTLILFVIFLIFGINITIISKSVFAESLSSKLKGKILLQVESKGEAWYVSPINGQRYSMGRPNDAFNLMRKSGIGISNNNLKKIQIADENLNGQDSDNDGLSDAVEDSIGTDKNNKDSDSDSYSDKDEILKGYNPNGVGKVISDINFSKNNAGKIFIQTEKNGEAWYINPNNNKRYFLGRPADAFNLMRELGLGISNSNLNKITKNNDKTYDPESERKIIPAEPICGNNIKEGVEVCDGLDIPNNFPANSICKTNCTGWTCVDGFYKENNYCKINITTSPVLASSTPAQNCVVGQADSSGIIYSCDDGKKIMAATDAPDEMRFEHSARYYCKDWNFDGYTWRIPTWEEFVKIYQNLYNKKEIWSTFKSSKYWLKDDSSLCPSSAWNTYVDLTLKTSNCGNQFLDIMGVRCVQN